MKDISHHRIKFMDECFCDGRGCKIRMGRGPTSERIHEANSTYLNQSTKISLLLSLANDIPYFCSFRPTESNHNIDFLEFILDAIDHHYLERGDILVFDNASIHSDDDMLVVFDRMMDIFGIQVVRLPTYSPGLIYF